MEINPKDVMGNPIEITKVHAEECIRVVHGAAKRWAHHLRTWPYEPDMGDVVRFLGVANAKTPFSSVFAASGEFFHKRKYPKKSEKSK